MPDDLQVAGSLLNTPAMTAVHMHSPHHDVCIPLCITLLY